MPWRAGHLVLMDPQLGFTEEIDVEQRLSRDTLAVRDGLCEICGLALGALAVLGRRYLDKPIGAEDGRVTDGYGTHARCMLLALRFCPHFSGCEEDRGPVAFLLDQGRHPHWREEQRAGYLEGWPEVVRNAHHRPPEDAVALTMDDVRRLALRER